MGATQSQWKINPLRNLVREGVKEVLLCSAAFISAARARVEPAAKNRISTSFHTAHVPSPDAMVDDPPVKLDASSPRSNNDNDKNPNEEENISEPDGRQPTESYRKKAGEASTLSLPLIGG
ncbi:hypothetical protein GGX14DRAFT_389970 [Mycena pura]|uniref:Uncharacterized protein n=1 Tax=Mycena pura TaxID=153505 RepID=A0AAD6VTR1_9AGAR|nr:hypothetical protein GGX14DRAFT_389970 [Mycena pura]